MTTTNVNISTYYRSIFSDSGGSRTLTSVELEAMNDSNNVSEAVILGGGEDISVDISLNVPVPSSGVRLAGLQIKSFSKNIASDMTVAFSEDGVIFDPGLSVESTYLQANGLSSIGTTAISNDQAFCTPANRLVRVIGGETVLRVYNPDTNSWTVISLGFSLGDTPRVTASTIEPKVFIARGDGTSNWHSVDLNSSTVDALAPHPIVFNVNGAAPRGHALAFDSLRNWVYTYVGLPSDGKSFHIYDVDTDVWIYADNSHAGTRAWMVHASSVDLLCSLSTGGSLQRWSPNTFSFKSSIGISSPDGDIQRGASAAYSPKENLIFFGPGQPSVPPGPLTLRAVNPGATGVYSSSRDVIWVDSPTTINQPVKVSYNPNADVFYYWAINFGNNTFQFRNDEVAVISKHQYFSAAPSTDTPYNFIRYTQSAGSLNELEVIGASVTTIEGTSAKKADFPGVSLGLPSDSIVATITSAASEATVDTLVFIEPDGSEASRYVEISDDDVNWVSHCSHNDLSEFRCEVSNDNYDTVTCGYKCTLANGGILATDGFIAPNLSLGVTAVSGTSTFYVRGNLPGHTSVDIKEVNVGVEMIFDD